MSGRLAYLVIVRNGNEGIGKPEALRHAFQGYWSRRITDEHRLVYRIVEDEIRIAACSTTTAADRTVARALGLSSGWMRW